MAPTDAGRSDDLPPPTPLRIPQAVMRSGLVLGVLTMLAGIIVHAATGDPSRALDVGQLLRSGTTGDRLLTIGAAVLAATPGVQVAVLAVTWWRQHDRRSALVAVTVLVVLAAGAVIGLS